MTSLLAVMAATTRRRGEKTDRARARLKSCQEATSIVDSDTIVSGVHGCLNVGLVLEIAAAHGAIAD